MSAQPKEKEEIKAEIAEIFKGSYKYYMGSKTYSEENFKVFKNFEENILIFVSEQLTRVANGEFLKMCTSYTVNGKYEPLQVTIEKSLGDKWAKETFTPDKNMPQLEYTFETLDSTKTIKVQTPAKYHIATPASCTALMFTKAKKYDPTILNSFYIITSDNVWDYQKAIESKIIYYRCENIHVKDELTINKKTLSGTVFEVFMNDSDPADKRISYFLSKHHGIPYQVTIDKETRADIKNLTDMTPSRIEDFMT